MTASTSRHRKDVAMTQRTWFITGVGSGFGRHMTEQLLARGDRVAGTVRELDAMDDLQARHGDRLWLAHLDVTDTPAIKQVVNRAFAELGRVDVVVNNAGYGLFGAAEAFTDEQIVHQLNTNLLGSIQVIRAATPHLRAQGGGRILQISTYGGQAAGAGGSLYHASKWGIEGFVESMMQELAPFNIGVTIVEPGGARTKFRFGSAKVGAKMAVYEGTPVGRVHALLEDTSHLPKGDAARMAQLMIASVDQHPAPKRLVLGGDAYAALVKALRERLADIEPQKDFAASTDLA
ncbi:short-chain dehydrogenase/reductase [Cystobacter fuscus DSM 2262]|uniref:Short-chain dehydrogenase/reductase n=1 Tax=Cystobacter fuscus (strain ATCC 25194 / DSM 2262 / NBRC 100088 / M29) TaxID=1242864 RepID=S9QAE8_CYSF2|nr:SDR family oxidoreductase [Cystobacter fuscus]EPX58309.1 short-chain dehydrogenase/reductase [Cystobacter fuscus DSM 2262]